MGLSAKIYNFIKDQSPVSNLYKLAFIAVFGVLVYSNTFFTPFCFDDFLNILNNPLVTNAGLSGLRDAFYSRRAIGIISFQFNYFISGASVFGYHITNIAIHIASAMALYWMMLLILKTEMFEDGSDNALRRFPLPFIVSMLFVVHPVQTQAVTYIVQRFASLATLFYILVVVAYLSARLEQLSSRKLFTARAGGWFLAVPLFMFLAFYTKETAYTLPAAILLVELFFFKLTSRKVITLIAASTVVVTAITVKWAAVSYSIGDTFSAVDKATRVQTITSRTDYLLTQFRVIVTYLKLLIFPVNQRLDYDYSLSHSFLEPAVFCSFLLIATILLVAAMMLWRSKNSSPYLKLASFGIFWFFLTLAIESSIIPIIDLIFEHRLYLPSVGAFIAIPSVVMIFANNERKISDKTVFLSFVIITMLLAITAFNRNSVWKSEVSIWADSVKKSPLSARAWNNLGGAYIKEREAKSALQAIVRSIELDPSKADALNNLGIAIDIMGVYNDRFRRTTEMFGNIAVDSKILNAWLGDVNNNLGLAYEILGNTQKAAESYRNAVGFNPSMGLAYYNLGILSAQNGDSAGSSVQLQILRMIDPALAERLQARTGQR